MRTAIQQVSSAALCLFLFASGRTRRRTSRQLLACTPSSAARLPRTTVGREFGIPELCLITRVFLFAQLFALAMPHASRPPRAFTGGMVGYSGNERAPSQQRGRRFCALFARFSGQSLQVDPRWRRGVDDAVMIVKQNYGTTKASAC